MALQFTPVTIIGVMKNADNAPPMLVPAKGRYMMKDLSRLSKFHQVRKHPFVGSYFSSN